MDKVISKKGLKTCSFFILRVLKYLICWIKKAQGAYVLKDLDDFNKFFRNSSGSINLLDLIINIGMATILAVLLGYFYVKL